MSSLNVAIYDAMVAAWDSKYLYRRLSAERPQPVIDHCHSEPAQPVLPFRACRGGGAASAVLAFFFPQQAAFFNAKAEEAGHSRLLAGVQYPSDVQAGLELGRAVAQFVIARAERQLGRGLHWDDPTRRL